MCHSVNQDIVCKSFRCDSSDSHEEPERYVETDDNQRHAPEIVTRKQGNIDCDIVTPVSCRNRRN